MDAVAKLQKLTAETTLEECEKADLWAFAKMAELATPDEWPEITKGELVERIRQAGIESYREPDEDAEELIDCVVYIGPLSSTVVRGFGRVTRDEAIARADVTEAQWAALNGHPQVRSVD